MSNKVTRACPALKKDRERALALLKGKAWIRFDQYKWNLIGFYEQGERVIGVFAYNVNVKGFGGWTLSDQRLHWPIDMIFTDNPQKRNPNTPPGTMYSE